MGIVVGGEKAWKVRTQGDLVVAFHWINKEPSMVLFPLRRRLGAVPYVIPLPMAHTYAKRDGYPTPECMVKAVIAAQVMAMDTTKATIRNIMEAILDNLPDLVAMPPQPPQFTPSQGRAIADATLYAGGRKVVEGEITDVPEQLH